MSSTYDRRMDATYRGSSRQMLELLVDSPGRWATDGVDRTMPSPLDDATLRGYVETVIVDDTPADAIRQLERVLNEGLHGRVRIHMDIPELRAYAEGEGDLRVIRPATWPRPEYGDIHVIVIAADDGSCHALMQTDLDPDHLDRFETEVGFTGGHFLDAVLQETHLFGLVRELHRRDAPEDPPFVIVGHEPVNGPCLVLRAPSDATRRTARQFMDGLPTTAVAAWHRDGAKCCAIWDENVLALAAADPAVRPLISSYWRSQE